MQISEKYRRGIVVPLDANSARAMADENVDESIRVHFVEIPNQDDFDTIWKTGIFEAINEKIGSMLDDYEEESISAEMIPSLREIVSIYEKKLSSDASGWFFSELLKVCDVAQNSGMPIYFVL
jgi:hypothetical protein